MNGLIRIHPQDNVAVALRSLPKGSTQEPLLAGAVLRDIPAGHKIALCDIRTGQKIIKYGYPIGHALMDIRAGDWIHSDNLVTDLDQTPTYRYGGGCDAEEGVSDMSFLGYRRENGKVGIRNEIWIIPTVGCVNAIAQRLARQNEEIGRAAGIDGIVAFTHPYGCSQLGEDHENTAELLAALARHPHAGGVLVVGLGCENNTMSSFQKRIGTDVTNIRYMVCQELRDEMDVGKLLIEQLARQASRAKRSCQPLAELVVGLKCGGSDGLSGITANPVTGLVCDLLTQSGASVLLSEVPEMFGAEQLLMERCASRAVFDRMVDMIERYKGYFIENHQTVYENPSPGNKEGGITTLEEKSLGCVQKAGRSVVRGVLDYTERVKTAGLSLVYGPGNDLVSVTALSAAGANLVLFTTGRGTPFGGPVPTLKIATNHELAQNKSSWIDFDASTVLTTQPMQECAQDLLTLLLEIASGKTTKAEENGFREIAIFKNGVTL